MLKVAGIALVVLGGMAVPLALLGALGSAMDMDPPYEHTAPYFWGAAAGVATALAGCLLLFVGLRANKQRLNPAIP